MDCECVKGKGQGPLKRAQPLQGRRQEPSGGRPPAEAATPPRAGDPDPTGQARVAGEGLVLPWDFLGRILETHSAHPGHPEPPGGGGDPRSLPPKGQESCTACAGGVRRGRVSFKPL